MRCSVALRLFFRLGPGLLGHGGRGAGSGVWIDDDVLHGDPRSRARSVGAALRRDDGRLERVAGERALDAIAGEGRALVVEGKLRGQDRRVGAFHLEMKMPDPPRVEARLQRAERVAAVFARDAFSVELKARIAFFHVLIVKNLGICPLILPVRPVA